MLADLSTGLVAGTGGRYWRAVLVVEGRRRDYVVHPMGSLIKKRRKRMRKKKHKKMLKKTRWQRRANKK
jgi:hypothetical protein